ncbi:hypothetical protein ACF0H5_004005 [Mactra antiquata]
MEGIDRSEWEAPKTSKAMLDEYWDKLLKKADDNEQEEIKFFLHCTTLNGKKSILKCGRLNGGTTTLPDRAPLASYLGMKGIWFAIAPRELPRRSPYGTQRMKFRVRDIMTYLGRPIDTNDIDEDDQWHATEEDQGLEKEKKGKAKGNKDKKSRKKAQSHLKRQKECYLKHKLPEKQQLSQPMLFFENAHYYGNNQYVRLLLVHPQDPNVEWCLEFCKELDIRDNPFLQFLHGRIYTYRKGEHPNSSIFVEVLVVGDVVFNDLLEPPDWDEVGTMSRAGFDPRNGIC